MRMVDCLQLELCIVCSTWGLTEPKRGFADSEAACLKIVVHACDRRYICVQQSHMQ